MKTIPSLRRHHYVARASMFAIVLALIAAIVGCVDSAVPSYELTVASTDGGSVTVPGEGTFAYDEGMVVNLTATPDPGYEFVNWTGNVSTLDDVDNATTTIVMDSAHFIIGNFVRQQYDLAATSTAGGSITVPGEGTFTYDGGTVVNLVAEAEEGYKFVNWTGDASTVRDVNVAQTIITMDDSYAITANFESKYNPMVAGGGLHTVGLKADGTVVAVGYNEYGECIVVGWMDVVQVLAGTYHTVGLKANGTVISTGWCVYQQCPFYGWTDIIQVAGSYYHTVGLTSNGTVVAVGSSDDGQCNIDGWTNIIQVAAGVSHTVGLRADGTVIAVGSDKHGQCNVGGWRDIVEVAAGAYHTVGLRSDGSVVAVGGDWAGQCTVGGWMDIVQVSAGYSHTVALKSDGTVVAVGSNSSGESDVGGWTHIVQVSAGYNHTVALKSDGTVVAVGSNGWGQCWVDDWMLT